MAKPTPVIDFINKHLCPLPPEIPNSEPPLRKENIELFKQFVIDNPKANFIEFDAAYNTPLHVAAMTGLLEVCKIIVLKGGRPNSVNKIKMNPLMVAVSHNFPAIVEFFVAEKMDKKDLAMTDINGHTALRQAEDFQYAEIVKILRTPYQNFTQLSATTPALACKIAVLGDSDHFKDRFSNSLSKLKKARANIKNKAKHVSQKFNSRSEAEDETKKLKHTMKFEFGGGDETSKKRANVLLVDGSKNIAVFNDYLMANCQLYIIYIALGSSEQEVEVQGRISQLASCIESSRLWNKTNVPLRVSVLIEYELETMNLAQSIKRQLIFTYSSHDIDFRTQIFKSTDQRVNLMRFIEEPVRDILSKPTIAVPKLTEQVEKVLLKLAAKPDTNSKACFEITISEFHRELCLALGHAVPEDLVKRSLLAASAQSVHVLYLPDHPLLKDSIFLSTLDVRHLLRDFTEVCQYNKFLEKFTHRRYDTENLHGFITAVGFIDVTEDLNTPREQCRHCPLLELPPPESTTWKSFPKQLTRNYSAISQDRHPSSSSKAGGLELKMFYLVCESVSRTVFKAGLEIWRVQTLLISHLQSQVLVKRDHVMIIDDDCLTFAHLEMPREDVIELCVAGTGDVNNIDKFGAKLIKLLASLRFQPMPITDEEIKLQREAEQNLNSKDKVRSQSAVSTDSSLSTTDWYITTRKQWQEKQLKATMNIRCQWMTNLIASCQALCQLYYQNSLVAALQSKDFEGFKKLMENKENSISENGWKDLLSYELQAELLFLLAEDPRLQSFALFSSTQREVVRQQFVLHKGHKQLESLVRVSMLIPRSFWCRCLHDAINLGNIETFGVVLQHIDAVDIDYRELPSHLTSLQCAVLAGQSECVKALLKAGAQPFPMKDSISLFDSAIECGYETVCITLLDGTRDLSLLGTFPDLIKVTVKCSKPELSLKLFKLFANNHLHMSVDFMKAIRMIWEMDEGNNIVPNRAQLIFAHLKMCSPVDENIIAVSLKPAHKLETNTTFEHSKFDLLYDSNMLFLSFEGPIVALVEQSTSLHERYLLSLGLLYATCRLSIQNISLEVIEYIQKHEDVFSRELVTLLLAAEHSALHVLSAQAPYDRFALLCKGDSRPLGSEDADAEKSGLQQTSFRTSFITAVPLLTIKNVSVEDLHYVINELLAMVYSHDATETKENWRVLSQFCGMICTEFPITVRYLGLKMLTQNIISLRQESPRVLDRIFCSDFMFAIRPEHANLRTIEFFHRSVSHRIYTIQLELTSELDVTSQITVSTDGKFLELPGSNGIIDLPTFDTLSDKTTDFATLDFATLPQPLSLQLGTFEFFGCRSLTSLTLSGNDVNNWKNLLKFPLFPHLTYLEISAGCLSIIPDTICSLEKLKSLILSKNPFQVLPEALGQLINLTSLDISGSEVTAALPASMLNLEFVSDFKIESTPLWDAAVAKNRYMVKLTGYNRIVALIKALEEDNVFVDGKLYHCKVVLLGEPQSGKTAFIQDTGMSSVDVDARSYAPRLVRRFKDCTMTAEGASLKLHRKSIPRFSLGNGRSRPKGVPWRIIPLDTLTDIKINAEKLALYIDHPNGHRFPIKIRFFTVDTLNEWHSRLMRICGFIKENDRNVNIVPVSRLLTLVDTKHQSLDIGPLKTEKLQLTIWDVNSHMSTLLPIGLSSERMFIVFWDPNIDPLGLKVNHWITWILSSPVSHQEIRAIVVLANKVFDPEDKTTRPNYDDFQDKNLAARGERLKQLALQNFTTLAGAAKSNYNFSVVYLPQLSSLYYHTEFENLVKHVFNTAGSLRLNSTCEWWTDKVMSQITELFKSGKNVINFETVYTKMNPKAHLHSVAGKSAILYPEPLLRHVLRILHANSKIVLSLVSKRYIIINPSGLESLILSPLQRIMTRMEKEETIVFFTKDVEEILNSGLVANTDAIIDMLKAYGFLLHLQKENSESRSVFVLPQPPHRIKNSDPYLREFFKASFVYGMKYSFTREADGIEMPFCHPELPQRLFVELFTALHQHNSGRRLGTVTLFTRNQLLIREIDALPVNPKGNSQGEQSQKYICNLRLTIDEDEAVISIHMGCDEDLWKMQIPQVDSLVKRLFVAIETTIDEFSSNSILVQKTVYCPHCPLSVVQAGFAIPKQLHDLDSKLNPYTISCPSCHKRRLLNGLAFQNQLVSIWTRYNHESLHPTHAVAYRAGEITGRRFAIIHMNFKMPKRKDPRIAELEKQMDRISETLRDVIQELPVDSVAERL